MMGQPHYFSHVYAGTAQIVTSFVFHALWQTPLMAGATACAIRFGKPNVRVAHALWSAALAWCVLAPMLSTFAAHCAAQAAQRGDLVLLSYHSPGLDGLPSMARVPMWKRLILTHLNLHHGVRPFFLTPPPRIVNYVAAAYGLAVMMFALRLLMGWYRTRRLMRQSASAQIPRLIRAALEKQSSALGLREPQILLTRSVAGPALAGILHPAILLPLETAATLNPAEIEAVLAHELAHLRRRDPLAHALCRLLLMPVCFHPAAIWVAGRVRQTREMACDADAAAHMGSSTRYGRALLQVAERTGRGGAVGIGLFRSGLGLFETGLQLFGTGAMEERMQMLMKREVRETKFRRTTRCVAGAATVAVAMMAAGMLQVRPALAGERSPAQANTGKQELLQNTMETHRSEKTDAALPLLSGEHARQQMHRAQGELANASQSATSDEDRRKIATAQQMLAIAEQQVAAAGTSSHSDLFLHLDSLKLKADALERLDASRGERELVLKRELDRINSPEFRQQMEQAQQIDMEKIQASVQRELDRMNSPEFKAQMEQAKSFDSAQFQRAFADAQRLQDEAMKQMHANLLQLKADETARLSARNEFPAAQSSSAAPLAAMPASDQPTKLNGGVLAGLNTHKEQPKYPEEAKKNGVQGAVLLHVLVDETGRVEDVSVLQSPDQALSDSALAAVRQWTYTPYMLNGKPTAVESTVTVTYSLAK